jgi:hypothetical protein
VAGTGRLSGCVFSNRSAASDGRLQVTQGRVLVRYSVGELKAIVQEKMPVSVTNRMNWDRRNEEVS